MNNKMIKSLDLKESMLTCFNKKQDWSLKLITCKFLIKICRMFLMEKDSHQGSL